MHAHTGRDGGRARVSLRRNGGGQEGDLPAVDVDLHGESCLCGIGWRGDDVHEEPVAWMVSVQADEALHLRIFARFPKPDLVLERGACPSQERKHVASARLVSSQVRAICS